MPEDVFQLLNSHNQELMLDDLVEIRKQRALQEAEEPHVTLRRGP
jgi:hypothetical protein